MKKLTFAILAIAISINLIAQPKKTVVVDISHESKAEYTKVNPNIFLQYEDIVENQLGAKLILNEDKELNDSLLNEADLLIVLSPLKKDRQTSKNNLTATERTDIVQYVQKGGKLIVMQDEEDRVDMTQFGANDIIKPFAMEFGMDLPMKPNIGAKSLVGEVIKQEYELSYSGSRPIKGGTPLSLMNGDIPNVHAAYVKLDNGAKVVAFGETMVGLFMGGVTMTMPNGLSITWYGKDDTKFMKDLIQWSLE